MPNDPLDPEFEALQPTAKPGQAVPPTNVPVEMAGARGQAVQFGAELTGIGDVSRVLSGETPWTEAIAGTLPMMIGGPEARASEEALVGLAKSYPKVGPPILRDATTRKPITGKTVKQADKLVESGKAFWGKQLTPEAEMVQKRRGGGVVWRQIFRRQRRQRPAVHPQAAHSGIQRGDRAHLTHHWRATGRGGTPRHRARGNADLRHRRRDRSTASHSIAITGADRRCCGRARSRSAVKWEHHGSKTRILTGAIYRNRTLDVGCGWDK